MRPIRPNPLMPTLMVMVAAVLMRIDAIKRRLRGCLKIGRRERRVGMKFIVGAIGVEREALRSPRTASQPPPGPGPHVISPNRHPRRDSSAQSAPNPAASERCPSVPDENNRKWLRLSRDSHDHTHALTSETPTQTHSMLFHVLPCVKSPETALPIYSPLNSKPF
jgi:hypothetical protein